jgi:hypothetical protein
MYGDMSPKDDNEESLPEFLSYSLTTTDPTSVGRNGSANVVDGLFANAQALNRCLESSMQSKGTSSPPMWSMGSLPLPGRFTIYGSSVLRNHGVVGVSVVR